MFISPSNIKDLYTGILRFLSGLFSIEVLNSDRRLALPDYLISDLIVNGRLI